MQESWQAVRDTWPQLERSIAEVRETLLANLVMLGEIPAPTFGEQGRAAFLKDRFTECGLDSISEDEVGNVLTVIEGEDEQRNVLLLAHTDTVFPATLDHTITVLPDRAIGPGVGDNSLGAALIATMPTLLEHMGYKPKANLILMGGARSLGRGDLEGIRFFLEHTPRPIEAAICVEGAELGRLSYSALGMMRGEIVCSVPEEYDWSRFGQVSAIRTINDVINRIDRIGLPAKPRCKVVLGSIEGGQGYNTVARRCLLRFEIRSDADDILHDIAGEIQAIADEINAESAAQVEVNIFASRSSGGVPFGHPLVAFSRWAMEELSIEPRIAPSTSELSALIDHGVPAVTLGLTSGENLNADEEQIQLAPLTQGLMHVISVLLAIDQGICNEH